MHEKSGVCYQILWQAVRVKNEIDLNLEFLNNYLTFAAFDKGTYI